METPPQPIDVGCSHGVEVYNSYIYSIIKVRRLETVSKNSARINTVFTALIAGIIYFLFV
jgi:hypothetical protein